MAALLGVALTTTLHAQSSSASAFTYQGYLTENGAPENGTNGFQLSLYDAATPGTQQGLQIGSLNDGISLHPWSTLSVQNTRRQVKSFSLPNFNAPSTSFLPQLKSARFARSEVSSRCIARQLAGGAVTGSHLACSINHPRSAQPLSGPPFSNVSAARALPDARLRA